MTAKPQGLIDVHHHIIPPFYLTEYRDQIASGRGGQLTPAWTGWSPESTRQAMDEVGVETAVLSLSTPGVWFGDVARARDITRRVNDYAAGLVAKYPGRFGMFATIPLPDQDGSLAAIAYALDTLKADGIGLLTNYGDIWLGDPRFEPVMAELNRRKCVTFVHPSVPFCCRGLFPDISPIIAEIPADTTRAVTNLLFKGVFRRHREIRFIFCHAGGSVPMVACRMAHYGKQELATLAPDGVEAELARHFYDIGGTAYKPAMAALMALAPSSQILFGSDHPYVPVRDTAEAMAALGLSAPDLAAIGHDNARRLLPRLRRSPGL